MPPPLLRYCVSAGWTLFHFIVVDHDHLTMQPVLPDDPLADEDAVMTDFHASLSPDGKLWIPAVLREALDLSEQSVMMRVEEGVVNVYIRKVFETLGFRPA